MRSFVEFRAAASRALFKSGHMCRRFLARAEDLKQRLDRYVEAEKAKKVGDRYGRAVLRGYAVALLARLGLQGKENAGKATGGGGGAPEDPMVAWTRAVARYTGWLVVVGLFGAVVSSATLVAIKGQWDAMRADARPWIANNAEPGGMWGHEPKGAYVDIRFQLTNSGHEPSILVMPTAELLVDADEKTMEAVQTRLCGDARVADGRQGGVSVFPGQTFPFVDRIYLARAHAPATAGKSSHVAVSMVGCVDYRFPGNDRHHQTGFAYRLEPDASVRPVTDWPFDGADVEAKHWSLIPYSARGGLFLAD